MDGFPGEQKHHSPEIPFYGPAFEVGDKVMFANPTGGGYSNPKTYPQFESLDVINGVFTIASTEPAHRPSTGEHDDYGPYDYQRVVLEEIPDWRFANDRFKPAEN